MSRLPLPNKLSARGIQFSLETNVLIMGVLNATPDSFSDGGSYLDPVKAIDQVQQMVEEGADIIDIGGESTRPGAESIDEKEEIRRVKPIFEGLSHRCHAPLSVDTRKSAVAQLALDFGAVLVNDISALQHDSDMGRVVAQANAGLVLMHMQGTPQTMQRSPSYVNVIGEIRQFFVDRLSVAHDYGIAPDHILLDPGIGFGKNVSHNLTLISHLGELLNLGKPLMIGVSRKSFIGKILDNSVEDRCMGTAAAVTASILQGAQVVRVHEVSLMRDVVKMAKVLRESWVN